MCFLTPEKISLARSEFRQLQIIGWKNGDKFFEKFGVGNIPKGPNLPYERFCYYEALLEVLRNDDVKKYLQIHKGTPFYFLAWTAFDLKNYEKAVFYMDAAVSEDIRKSPNRPFKEWIKDPASQFWTLNLQGDQTALRITKKLRETIEIEFQRFNRFNRFFNEPVITIDIFIENFVKELLKQEITTRSIITALYSFVLEFNDLYNMLKLRSKGGGSIEPFLSHLFKGCLIFESLLKYLYNSKSNNIKTLGDLNQNCKFKEDFFELNTTSSTLREIKVAIINNSIETAFNTTAKIRNTSGHNLVWDDIFNEADNFKQFYRQIINAIFYIITKKFLCPNTTTQTAQKISITQTTKNRLNYPAPR